MSHRGAVPVHRLFYIMASDYICQIIPKSRMQHKADLAYVQSQLPYRQSMQVEIDESCNNRFDCNQLGSRHSVAIEWRENTLAAGHVLRQASCTQNVSGFFGQKCAVYKMPSLGKSDTPERPGHKEYFQHM